ncbi:DUF692 domain-containing protein [uncultured Parvibaculum sp.]|uniref:MNIO family bufferin maturase n=1 Tax=uncultured Parvibaculum sp. TaxID=291828 RepID=UPI0030DBDADF
MTIPPSHDAPASSAGSGRSRLGRPTPAACPRAAGVGLKADHYREILDTRPAIGWFEVHAENFMGAGGAPHRYLTAIREHYPLSLHGVGLSLGSAGPLDRAHAKRLRALVDRYEPGLVSEHLAWSRHDGIHFNDLLPVPLTEEALDIVAEHVEETQDILGRRMLIENPSTYVATRDEMSETEFLVALARRTGCGLLVDVNNVYVSSMNHGRDAAAWLDAITADLVGEIHLAGHAVEMVEGEALRIDDHGSRVSPEVFELCGRFLDRVGPVPTLIEWDSDVPPLSVLLEEASKADKLLLRAQAQAAMMGRAHD